MNKKRWSNEDVVLLQEYYTRGNLLDLSILINKSINSIKNKAHRLGLKRIVKGNNCPDKKCTRCKQIKPRTSDFFFTKKTKTKLANGSVKEYICFRSLCKKCHGKDTHLRTKRKKAIEKGMSLSEYQDWCKWFMKEGLKSVYDQHVYKYKFLDDLGVSLREKRTIVKKILKGYNWQGIDQYRLDCLNLKIQTHKKRHKYNDLPSGYDFYYQLPKDLKNKILRKRKPTKGVIANWLGIKVDELDVETEKTKRLLHSISSFIKNNRIDNS